MARVAISSVIVGFLFAALIVADWVVRQIYSVLP